MGRGASPLPIVSENLVFLYLFWFLNGFEMCFLPCLSFLVFSGFSMVLALLGAPLLWDSTAMMWTPHADDPPIVVCPIIVLSQYCIFVCIVHKNTLSKLTKIIRALYAKLKSDWSQRPCPGGILLDCKPPMGSIDARDGATGPFPGPRLGSLPPTPGSQCC